MSNVRCPACGDLNGVQRKVTTHYPLTLGDGFDVVEDLIFCDECEETSFADDKSKNAYAEALSIARKNLAGELIQRLQDKGITMVEIERALQLPPKTLNRWKSANDSSATALALLRILITCPFVIEIAKAKFDIGATRDIVLLAGADIKPAESKLSASKNPTDDDVTETLTMPNVYQFPYLSTGT